MRFFAKGRDRYPGGFLFYWQINSRLNPNKYLKNDQMIQENLFYSIEDISNEFYLHCKEYQLSIQF
ncbi:hypothetical protein TTHERM_00510170 (macronuclear) [Tetrahymena thermophila SB210]|uniref:Uncharacterized protein n=1 Tax=Tetrahymena thermophila (strain SB210) TaxID=312017 RepID=I7M7N5_TETTS|nr:hypothetical protein TTHERM_00510170 [Tetrahymena thermophila SB210]EAR94977.2 hypothetical protein TTHERM_00510170 [Tetrahymena thermophila SB210]|eukprot:XP_001015222.2 hypothetical protein TTHERM_00510170 [Tetrahymena thermophila SB210]